MKRPIEVITTHPFTETQYLKKIIDYSNRSDRVWLGNHCHWALNNGFSVTTKPIFEEVAI